LPVKGRDLSGREEILRERGYDARLAMSSLSPHRPGRERPGTDEVLQPASAGTIAPVGVEAPGIAAGAGIR